MSVTERLLAGGRGLLSLDQPPADLAGLLSMAKVPATTGAGAAFRALVLATPGLDRLVSGVLLDTATIRSSAGLPRVLTAGTVALGVRIHDVGDTTSDRDLAREIAAHAAAGVRFARTRTTVGPDTPGTVTAAASRAVARWAAVCREHGVTPYPDWTVRVPPRFGLGDSERLHTQTLGSLTAELAATGIDPATLLLGITPVVPGRHTVASAEDVAAATLRSLRAAGVADAPGVRVVFTAAGPVHHLSAQLVAMQWTSSARTLGCRFGAGLLGAVAGVWRGRPDRAAPAQRELHSRLRAAAALQRAVALERPGRA